MVTPEEKSSILVEGLYSFFGGDMCGTQQHKKQTKDQEESNKKHDRAKVTELRNVARRGFMKVKRERIDEERGH